MDQRNSVHEIRYRAKNRVVNILQATELNHNAPKDLDDVT